MTRLVVVAGTHATDWEATRQQLVSWRPELEAQGVRLSPGDDADAWTSVARELTSGKPARDVVAAVRALTEQGADALLIGSDQLEDPLRDPVTLGHLNAQAVDLDMPLTVVVVLRDQVGYLNELYCDRVTALQTARSFDAFTAAPQPVERFDYATALQPLIRSTGATLVAVPYSQLVDGKQGRAIARAAGLAAAAAGALPAGSRRTSLPGPVVIAAHRLLYKRAWRLGLVKTLPRPRLMGAARALRQHSLEQGWDSTEFWGWTPATREQAAARYQAGNDEVATQLWDRLWGDDWASGTYAEADLAACAPDMVVDVLGFVDSLVRDLQKTKGAAPAGATDD